MSVEEYIDNVVTFLYQNKIYDSTDLEEKERIEAKVQKIKTICLNEDEYKTKSFVEIKEMIDKMVEDILIKQTSLRQNYDEVHQYYAKKNNQIGYGKTLLEKKSITTDETLEIAYCTIGTGSLHLHCGISRKIDFIDKDGKEITHFHNLLRRLKKYYAWKYQVEEKEELEKICYEKVIYPYIIETLLNVVFLCNSCSNIKTIHLDTNDGFFQLVGPTLKEFGFEYIDEQDKFHIEELAKEFPNYKFPDELEKFYQDYPDRKNSLTIHIQDLKERMKHYEFPKRKDKSFFKAA